MRKIFYLSLLIPPTLFMLTQFGDQSAPVIVVKPELIKNQTLIEVLNDDATPTSYIYRFKRDNAYYLADKLRKELGILAKFDQSPADLGYSTTDGFSSLSVDNSNLATWQYQHFIKECEDSQTRNDFCYHKNPSKILSLTHAQSLIKNSLGSFKDFDFSFKDKKGLLIITAHKVIDGASTPLSWDFTFTQVNDLPFLKSATGFLAIATKEKMVKTLNSTQTASLLETRIANPKGITKANFYRKLLLVYDIQGDIWLLPGYSFFLNKEEYTEIALSESVVKRVHD